MVTGARPRARQWFGHVRGPRRAWRRWRAPARPCPRSRSSLLCRCSTLSSASRRGRRGPWGTCPWGPSRSRRAPAKGHTREAAAWLAAEVVEPVDESYHVVSRRGAALWDTLLLGGSRRWRDIGPASRPWHPTREHEIYAKFTESRTRSSHAVVLESPEAALAEGVLEGEHREDLDDAHVEEHDGPEGLERGLLVGDVRRHVDIAAEERVEVLRHREAEGREHGHAAVLELALAEVLGALP